MQYAWSIIYPEFRCHSIESSDSLPAVSSAFLDSRVVSLHPRRGCSMGIVARIRSLFKRRVHVTFRDGTFVYDGVSHELPYEVEGLPEGYTLRPVRFPALQDATRGPVEVRPASYSITNKAGKNVTAKYEIEETLGHITVSPARLMVSSGSAQKAWDGKPLRCPEVRVEGLAAGEHLIVCSVGTITDEGSTDNTVEVDWAVSTAKAGNYALEFALGTLAVEPAELEVQSDCTTVVYDGHPHDFVVQVPDGASIEYVDTAEKVGVGSYDAEFLVTMPHHRVTRGVAHLSIIPRPLRVRACSMAKVYDGEPLSCDISEVDGLVDGETLAVVLSGSITDVGTVANVASVDWGASSAKCDNYQVECINGTLYVTPAELEVQAAPVKCVYDGMPHGVDIRIPDGATIEFAGESSFVDAGEYKVPFRVARPNHSDYLGEAVLNIVPKPLLIAAASRQKAWDGEALECAEVRVEGLLPGESLVARATGSIINEGSACNPVEVDWEASTAKVGNYKLELVSGVLTVECARLNVRVVPVRAVYDGLPHGYGIRVPEGAALDILDQAEHVDAGSYETEFVVSMPHHFDFRGVATLTIEPACIAVDKFGCEEVAYDGEPHLPTIDVPEGATVELDCGEGYVEVGSYRINAVISKPNYDSVCIERVLNIVDSSEPVMVCVAGGRFCYDGKEHGATIEPIVLPKGYVLARAESTARVLNVEDGLVLAECDILRIEDMDGRDVTDRLNIVYSDAAISIAPRSVNVMTFDARKPYDGKPLVSNEARVYGLVEGETASVVVTGEQTDVGQCENTAKLLFDGTAKASNYYVKHSFGKLTVEEALEGARPKPDGSADCAVDENLRTDEPACPTSEDHAGEMGHEAARPRAEQPLQAQVDVSQEPPFVSSGLLPVAEDESLIDWHKPSVRPTSSTVVSRASRERRRRFTRTPVDERPDLEEMGLGKEFRPFSDLGLTRYIGDTNLSQTIRECEEKARAAIDDVRDQYPDALLFQTFSVLGLDLPVICDTVHQIFNYGIFRADKRYALAYIHDNCQNAFLIYVASLAREYSNADGIWSEMFKNVDVGDASAQQKFKQMFVAYLYQRKLPVFESNEEPHYLARTAYLHGGFSRDVWRRLWGDVLVPMARKKDLPDNAAGESVLSHVLERMSKNTVAERRTRVLLEKAPRQVTANIFEMAWRVANDSVEAGSRSSLIANPGLSSVAMAALMEVLNGSHAAPQTHSPRRAVFLDGVKLMLDASGVVHVAWNSAEMPSAMAGSRVDFYVNGELAASCDIEKMTMHARLGAGGIEVAPRTRYDVETRLMSPSPEGELFEVASMFQSFQSSKPNCYEFIRTPQGEYRFRGPDERITRARRIAYLVPEGMSVVGVCGMELLNVMDCTHAWSAMRVFEFAVKPGAAGVIVDEATNEVVTAWHEDYRVGVDKSKAIGRVGNIDLYGHVIGIGETDVALPSIKIEAPEGTSADDVEVRFIRNGREGALDSSWELDEDGRPVELELSFPSSEQGRGIAKHCVIEARQKATGNRLLRYRFAIVPIQAFRLEDCKIIDKKLYGVYGFTATEDVEVAQIEGSFTHQSDSLVTGEDAFIETLLEEETARVRFSLPAGDALEAELLLAGIKIEIDQELLRVAETASVNLATLQNLGAGQDVIRISTSSPRRGRAIQIRLGGRVALMKKQLDKASDTEFALLDNKSLFMPQEGTVYEVMELQAFICFGYKLSEGKYEPSLVQYDLLRCAKGLGFKDCCVRLVGDRRKEMLCFDADSKSKDLMCDLHVTFASGTNRYSDVYGEGIAEAGTRRIPLPAEAKEAYRKKGLFYVTVTTVSLFGGPDPDNEITIPVSKRRGKR